MEEKKLTDAELLERAKMAQREYHKKWRSANKERIKEYNQKYWLKKVQEEINQN